MVSLHSITAVVTSLAISVAFLGDPSFSIAVLSSVAAFVCLAGLAPHAAFQQRGVGFWLRSLAQVRHLGDLLLRDAAVLAAAETGGGSGHLGSGSQVFGASHQGSSSSSSMASPSTDAAGASFYHSDLSALWAVASNRLNFVKAAYKQQKNMKVGRTGSSSFSLRRRVEREKIQS